MVSAADAARYLLSLDKGGDIFTDDTCEVDGKQYISGNVKLNIMLQLAQNLHIAKYGKPLIDADFCACEYGGYIPELGIGEINDSKQRS